MLRRSFTVLPFVVFVMTLLMAAPAWAQAALTIEKTDDPDPVTEGKVLTYTIVVENTGTEPTVTPVEVRDDLPANTTFVSAETTRGTCPTQPAPGTPNTANPDVICNLGNLSEGTDATVTIKVKPTNAAAIAGTITNRAQAISGTIDRSTEENTAVTPGLSIVKEDSPGTIEVGDDLRYNLTVRNRGGSNAANVVVRDELPSQVEFVQSDADQGGCDEQPEGVVECDLGTINAGATVGIELLVRATEAGDITNRAEVFAGDGEEAIDEDTETTEVEDGGGGGGGGGSDNTSGIPAGTPAIGSNPDNPSGPPDLITIDIADCVVDQGASITLEDGDGTEARFVDGEREIEIVANSGEVRIEGPNDDFIGDHATFPTSDTSFDTDGDYRVVSTTGITGCADENGGGGGNNNDNNNNNNNNDNNRNASLNDLDRDLRGFRNADNLRCEEVLAIDRSATRDQYDVSAELIEDCRRDVVLVDTIPRKVKSLPNTGGPPLVLLAAGVLLVSGLLAGASVYRTVTRRGE